MRRLWLGAAAALLIVCAVASVVLLTRSSHRPSRSLSPPALPAPSAEQFGINVNRLFDAHAFGPFEVAAQLQALRATGATLARSDALWELTEPAPPTGGVHHYNWSFDDRIAGALAAQRLRWLPIVDYTATWDQSQANLQHTPPRTPQDYAAFAAALAARYGPGGTFWRARPDLTPEPVDTYEIWNEPDNGQFWAPTPDPAAYASLYLASRAAIRAVDPSARVIIGGLTRAPSFLPALIHARPSLIGHTDGVAIHPYGRNAAAVLGKVRAARATLASLGLGSVPLYVSEFGWTTHPAGTLNFASADQRPRDILTTIAALGHTNCGIAAVLLYTWVTPERSALDKEDWFGIHPPAGGSTAATEAFAAGLRRAAAPARTLPVCGASG